MQNVVRRSCSEILLRRSRYTTPEDRAGYGTIHDIEWIHDTLDPSFVDVRHKLPDGFLCLGTSRVVCQ